MQKEVFVSLILFTFWIPFPGLEIVVIVYLFVFGFFSFTYLPVLKVDGLLFLFEFRIYRVFEYTQI